MKRLLLLWFILLIITSCKKENLYHQISVENGSGSGIYELGSVVEIVADKHDTGFVFSMWTGDTIHLINPEASTTTLVMPFKDIELKANFEVAPYFHLNVIRGSGSGQYQAGKLINVTSDPPASDSGFYQWQGDIQYLEEPRSPNTLLTMPDRNISIRAMYSELPRYPLTVNLGSGSGNYLAGTVVNISAIPPSNKFFKEWSGDIQFIDDISAENTTVNMPAQAVEISAEFEDAISFNQQVLPLIIAECSTSGCHDANSPNEPLTNYQEIKLHDQDIRYRVQTGNMPPSKILTTQQKETIIKWIDQGSMNN